MGTSVQFDARMKINIANPATGAQKLLDVEDDPKVRHFMDKRISAEVAADPLGEEFAGYVFKITGGNDKQGFPMKQGVLLPHRTRILLSKGDSCYRSKRSGERKSVRGCIVQQDLSVINVVIVKRGPADLPGLTDVSHPRRLGPKRVTKIRKLFDLDEDDDVRKFVVRRAIEKNGKTFYKSPKIQRLVTPRRLERKRRRLNEKKQIIAKKVAEAQAYADLLAERASKRKAERAAQLAKKKKGGK